MAITPSQRQTREWPLLVLALALVCAVCIPLWQWTAGQEGGGDFWTRWTPERLGRLLLGPGAGPLLLLLHLGRVHHRQPLPGAAPPAPRLRAGAFAHRRGGAHPAGG